MAIRSSSFTSASVQLFNYVLTLVVLAIGECEFEVILSGGIRDGNGQAVGVCGITPDLVIRVTGHSGGDGSDGCIGIDVHYSPDVVTMRSLSTVAETWQCTS